MWQPAPPALTSASGHPGAGDLPPQTISQAGPLLEGAFRGVKDGTPRLPCVGLCPPLVTGSWKDRALKSAAPAQL